MTGLLEWARLNWSLLAFIFGLALIFVLFRTQPTAGIDSPETLDKALVTGQPVVVEFYSNF